MNKFLDFHLSPVPPGAALSVDMDGFADRLGCLVSDRIPFGKRVPERRESERGGDVVITLAWPGNAEQAVTLNIVIAGVTDLPEVPDDAMDIRVKDRATAEYFIGCLMEAANPGKT